MPKRPLIAVTQIMLLLSLLTPPVTATAKGCGNRDTLPDTPPTTHGFHDDLMLGPDPLPHDAPVGPIVVGYKRFGATDLDGFKHNFVKPSVDDRHPASWIWPPGPDGFATKSGGSLGAPDRKQITLKAGTLLDRFGFATGKFLAPKGTPFGQRALPPQALETADHTNPDYQGLKWTQNTIIPPSNYHVYCVQNDFKVDAGPIAPWFGQPGLGTQYVLMPGYVDKQPNDKLNMLWLLANGPKGPGLADPYLIEQRP
jgi:Tuberculosis necrotizing toxin